MRPSNLKTSPAIIGRTTESSGRVRHDDRGTAVWDWALDTGTFDALSSSGLLRRLEVAELKMQDALVIEGCDAGSGGDPYNSMSPRTRFR